MPTLYNRPPGTVTLNALTKVALDQGYPPHAIREWLHTELERHPPPRFPRLWKLKFTPDMRGFILVTPRGEISGDEVLLDPRSPAEVYGAAKHAGGRRNLSVWREVERLDDEICAREFATTGRYPLKKTRADEIRGALSEKKKPALGTIRNRLVTRPRTKPPKPEN